MPARGREGRVLRTTASSAPSPLLIVRNNTFAEIDRHLLQIAAEQADPTPFLLAAQAGVAVTRLSLNLQSNVKLQRVNDFISSCALQTAFVANSCIFSVSK